MKKRCVDVLMCTFQREAVTQTLDSLAQIDVPEGTTFRVIIADNDDTPSARNRVEMAAKSLPYAVLYLHAPARNISIARNASLDAVTAEWIALLDDDEYVARDWLSELLARAEATGADAIFGPVVADYDDDTPDWIRNRDYHSSYPQRRNGQVETGLTGNALLRWGDVSWRDERFDLARGKSGGEDTEFFFRLNNAGAHFEISDTAIVHEAVPKERLTYQWLRRRKYRMGQSYAVSASSTAARIKLAVSSIAKAAVCCGGAVLTLPSKEKRCYWMLRGTLHLGIFAGCLSLRQAEHYGSDVSEL